MRCSEWPTQSAGETVKLLGVDIELDIQDPQLASMLRLLWADCDPPFGLGATSPPPSSAAAIQVKGDNPWVVSIGNAQTSAWSRSAALSLVLAGLNAAAIAGTPHLALHCAVVARGGRAIALPARSGRGKTTTTAALLQQGWEYVSDEVLALSWTDGTVTGYPRPLSLSPWAAATLGVHEGLDADGETVLTAGQLGSRAVAVTEPVVVDAVVLLERAVGRCEDSGELVPASAAEAITQLLPRCFNHFHDPARTLELLTDLVATTEVTSFRLGHPTRSAQTLGAWLDR